jgi:xanthine/uracil permease
MNNPRIFLVSFLVITLASLIVSSFFRGFVDFSSLLIGLIGGLWVTSGVDYRQRAKTRGVSVPWWKWWDIAGALGFVMLVVWYIVSQFIPKDAGSLLITLLITLLSLGLVIYAVIVKNRQDV